MSMTTEQQAEHWLTKGGPEPGTDGADEYYAKLGVEVTETPADPAPEVEARITDIDRENSVITIEDVPVETPPEQEAAPDPNRRVLTYKYNREEQEIDLDRLATDEAYQAEVREYVEKGRGLEQTSKRIEQVRQETQQATVEWLRSQGYSFTQTPEGEWSLVPPQTATAAERPQSEAPATDFAELEKRAAEGDAEAILDLIKATRSSVESSKAAAVQEVEARLERERRQRVQSKEYERQAAFVRQQIEDTIERRAKSFDSSPMKDHWLEMVRREAFNKATEQGATIEDVVARVETYANALDRERTETLRRHQVPATPVNPAPPVPGGGPPGKQPDQLLDYDDPNFVADIAQRLRASAGA
jgi:hypothetical protein